MPFINFIADTTYTFSRSGGHNPSVPNLLKMDTSVSCCTVAVQAQQVQHNQEFFHQVLDAQNQIKEREREKDRTFLLELGKLFANQK